MIQVSFTFAVLFACAVSCAVLANMTALIIIGKLNRKLSDEQQLSYVRWSLAEITRLYRRLYPRGRLVLLMHVFGGLMILFFLASFWVRRFAQP